MIGILLRYKYLTKIGILVSFLLLSFIIFTLITIYNFQDISIFAKLDNQIYKLLKFTIFQAFLSTILSLLIGILLAWSLSYKSNFFGRKILIALFSSSLVLPSIIVAFGLIGIFGRNGYLNQLSLFAIDTSFGSYIYGLAGILLAHVYLNASFTSSTLLHYFQSIPTEKYKLAKSLNFTLWQRFRYIEYPAIKSTLLGISSTIFLLCFSSFAIVLLLGGSPQYNTLEVAIYEAVKLDFDLSLALQLSLIQISIAAFLVMATSNLSIEASNIKTSLSHNNIAYSKHLNIFQFGLIFIFTLFFISPLIVIIINGIDADFYKIINNKIFINAFITSLVFAVLSSLITIFITILLSNARVNLTLTSQDKDTKTNKFLNILIIFSSNIYLAVSSIVLGLGFFLIALKYDDLGDTLSYIAILTANILMALPFSHTIITPIMRKIANRYDKLSRSLNLSIIQKWQYVYFPYLRASLGYVFALVFCISLGDLGIIALFGNDTLTTLPWYLYQLMGSYRTLDANGVALILLILILSVFIFIPKMFRSKNAYN